MTSWPLVRRIRATLRKAELGFLGLVVYTRVHTPRRCGHPAKAGTLLRLALTRLGLRTSWLIVGILLATPRAKTSPTVTSEVTPKNPEGSTPSQPVQATAQCRQCQLVLCDPWLNRQPFQYQTTIHDKPALDQLAHSNPVPAPTLLRAEHDNPA